MSNLTLNKNKFINNPSVIHPESIRNLSVTCGSTSKEAVDLKTLNAIENAILTYWRSHSNECMIEYYHSSTKPKNAYQYFALKLGYKSINYLYNWFQTRDKSKIGLSDIKGIFRITHDEYILQCFIEECKEDED